MAASAAGAVASAARTAAEVAATTAAAMTAVGAFAAMFAAGLVGTGGGHEDGLVGHAEQGGQLALQRGPEADGFLDRDDDGFDLDARTLFATRAILTARTLAFVARFAARAVALRDARLAAFFGGAFLARLTARFTARAAFAFGAAFALGGSRRLGAVAGEVLGQLGRIFDDADGRAGGLAVASGRSDAARGAAAAELLRLRDGSGLGGGFGRGPDHGERREFRVGGLQLGFVEAGGGGADFTGACVRGGLVGGDWLLARGFFLAHVAYVGAAIVVADRMMRPFRCGAATRFVGPLVAEGEPPRGPKRSGNDSRKECE